MSFDLDQMADAVSRYGRVVRVVICRTRGSVPREVGAAMLVWKDGFSGTIGGGALEFDALAKARDVLSGGSEVICPVPLGPALNQCCGGHVTWIAEIWDAARLAEVENVVARPLPGTPKAMPFSVRRALAATRTAAAAPKLPKVIDGWLIEPIQRPEKVLWLYGAGHVGRALVGVMAPLPDWTIGWVDTSIDRFPKDVPKGVRTLPVPDPVNAVALAPETAHHLVLTYSHALDQALVATVLRQAHGSIGLIGSATKWARFRRRLSEMGLPQDLIETVRCPIGVPSLGKHPQEIALGVAQELLAVAQRKKTRTQGPGRLSLRGET